MDSVEFRSGLSEPLGDPVIAAIENALTLYAPTVQGYSALRQLREVRRSAVAAAIDEWSNADRLELLRLLRRLVADWQQPVTRSRSETRGHERSGRARPTRGGAQMAE